jgi:hypothetical protein
MRRAVTSLMGQFGKLSAKSLPDHRLWLLSPPEWDATANEDGRYSFAVALQDPLRPAMHSFAAVSATSA